MDYPNNRKRVHRQISGRHHHRRFTDTPLQNRRSVHMLANIILLARVFSHGRCFTPWLGSPRLIGAATGCRPKATRRYFQAGPKPQLAITAYCVAGTSLEAPRAAPMPWLVGRSCSEDGVLEGICTSVLYELAP